MTNAHVDTGERLVHVTDEHWVKYVVPVTVSFFLLAIAILLFVLAGVSAHHTMWLSHIAFIAALILFLLTFHWLFLVLLSEAMDRIIITNKRLIRIHYRMIFHEDILEISFSKMKSVDVRKSGLIQNLLHYGTLVFEMNKAFVHLVPHPNRVARVIQEAMMN